MRSIYNYPVVPEESERHRTAKELSVTRADWGTDFRNGVSFEGNSLATKSNKEI